MNFNQAREKIAKLLRLQTSKNAGEASNAAKFVEKLCRKYGISSAECETYDPERDEVIEFTFGKSYYKADVAVNLLINGVSKYYNGTCIITNCKSQQGKRIMSVIASKSNRIQIELYLDYLIETMNKLATEAKKSGAWGTKSSTYKANFRKGFATQIHKRLIAMTNEQKRNGKPDLNQPALVVLNKNALEQKATLTYLNDTYPHRRLGGKSRGSGVGYADGKEKASSVGLNKQAEGSRKPLALSGS